jgi:endopolyphosphatase
MIPEYELHTFERGGYFAVEVVPNKLAVVSLNTLYWCLHPQCRADSRFSSNAAVDGCDRKSEPGSLQFEWLRSGSL